VIVPTAELGAPGHRALSPFQWNREGRRTVSIEVCAGIPTYDDGMIRRALLRASLLAQNTVELRHAINREMFEIGFSARTRSEGDGALVVEVWRHRAAAAGI
jgi:hypothetical protein